MGDSYYLQVVRITQTLTYRLPSRGPRRSLARGASATPGARQGLPRAHRGRRSSRESRWIRSATRAFARSWLRLQVPLGSSSAPCGARARLGQGEIPCSAVSTRRPPLSLVRPSATSYRTLADGGSYLDFVPTTA